MNDDELIQKLGRARPAPPPAPASEWEAVASRTVEAPPLWRRLRLPALGTALAMAALTLALRGPALEENEALEAQRTWEFLDESRQSLKGDLKLSSDRYLALVEGLK